MTDSTVKGKSMDTSDYPELAVLANRRSFIGGSDARIIMGDDETALLRLWREKRGEAEPEDLSGNGSAPVGSSPGRRNWKLSTGQRKPVLTEPESGASRDLLLRELTGLNTPDELASWAHRILPTKNTLTAIDARLLEEAFASKMTALADAGEEEAQKARTADTDSMRPAATNTCCGGKHDRLCLRWSHCGAASDSRTVQPFHSRSGGANPMPCPTSSGDRSRGQRNHKLGLFGKFYSTRLVQRK
jgi:hypothetical protein